MMRIRIILGVVALIGSGAALAHTGSHAGGWTAGFAHPFMGLDHLLAMIAVGIWAVQLGGHYRLLLPAVFLAAMMAGATGSAAGLPLPQVEGMIAVSVLVLGMLVALAVKTQWHWPVSLVALFALFHGHVHGTGMSELVAPWIYFSGFLLATALLHALGVFAATLLKLHPRVIRAGGAAMSVAGTGLLVAALI